MLENILSFKSVLPTAGMTLGSFAICFGVALALGILLSLCFRYRNRPGQTMLLSLSLLPSIAMVVVMLVGKNLGAGIALAGAFSLVRFRSQPGNALEICVMLLACTLGFACGAGQLLVAVLLFVVSVIVGFVFKRFGIGSASEQKRVLKITIPETLDYTGLFEDLLDTYTVFWSCISVKTAEMGSLYKLTYEISLKDPKQEKQFLDEIRCRNGNLEVLCGRPVDRKGEL